MARNKHHNVEFPREAIERPRVAWVVSVPENIRVASKPHIQALSGIYEVTVYTNLQGGSAPFELDDLNVKWRDVDLRRKVAPIADFRALFVLIREFYRERPRAVISQLPKSGLLAMISSFLTEVPVRIHTFTGQVWSTRQGVGRRLLKWADRVVGRLASHVYVDGHGQLDYLIAERVIKSGQVFGSGSICGIDHDRFRPNEVLRARARIAVGVPSDSFVIGFVGRINRDKGVFDLVEAFKEADIPSSSKLLLVGFDEENVQEEIRKHLDVGFTKRIVFLGHQSAVEEWIPAFDVFCLPSHREGFATSVLEASSCEIPVIVSDIYGLVGTVRENCTGWSFPVGDTHALRAVIENAFLLGKGREAFGRAGRRWVISSFEPTKIVRERLAVTQNIIDGVR